MGESCRCEDSVPVRGRQPSRHRRPEAGPSLSCRAEPVQTRHCWCYQHFCRGTDGSVLLTRVPLSLCNDASRCSVRMLQRRILLQVCTIDSGLLCCAQLQYPACKSLKCWHYLFDDCL